MRASRRSALLFARSFFGSGVAAETQSLLVHDEINVFGETLDEFPRFGKRSAAFESEVRSNFRQRETVRAASSKPKNLFPRSRPASAFAPRPEGRRAGVLAANLRKPSMIQVVPAASRCRMFATHAGACLRSFSNCALSVALVGGEEWQAPCHPHGVVPDGEALE